MIRRVLSVSRYLVPALVIACWTTATTLHAAQAATLMVDVDGQASAADCNGVSGAFTTIQAAVNAAAPGDTIFVCPGIYSEQVVVPNRRGSLTIRGSGADVTVLRPTAVAQNTTTLLSGAPAAPILLVDGAANITIANLTIDGGLADSGAAIRASCSTVGFYFGIYYRNSTGTIDTAHVTNVTSSQVCTEAVRAESSNILATKKLHRPLRFWGAHVRWAEYLLHDHGKCGARPGTSGQPNPIRHRTS
jgi:hypothetical protein